MVIDTSTDVERLASVEKPDGTRGQPANANLQRETARGFTRGAGFDTNDSASFPISVSPSATVTEILLPVVGAELQLSITTTAGDVVSIPLTGPSVIDTWRVDSFEITDPNNSGARVAGAWAGE